jgi:hypothetical protein
MLNQRFLLIRFTGTTNWYSSRTFGSEIKDVVPDGLGSGYIMAVVGGGGNITWGPRASMISTVRIFYPSPGHSRTQLFLLMLLSFPGRFQNNYTTKMYQRWPMQEGVRSWGTVYLWAEYNCSSVAISREYRCDGIYSWSDIVTVIKCKSLRWEGHVVCFDQLVMWKPLVK